MKKSVTLPAVLPHSAESERAVLGAVLMDADVVPRICSRLKAENFYLESHQILFRAIAALHTSGTEVDLRTLQARLELEGNLDAAGGLGYLATLDLDLPDIGRLDAYLDIVAERSGRRELIALAGEAMRDGLGTADLEETLAALQAKVPELLASAVRPRLRSLGEIVPPLLERVEDRGDQALRGLPTGFARLDELTDGLHAGHLVIIAGRPGLGKSAFACNVAQNVALHQGRPVGIWSLEMTEDELALRMLCSEADVPSTLLRKGFLSQSQWRRLINAGRSLSAAPVYVDDTPNLSAAQLEGRIRRVQEEHGLALVVVDYLQLLQGGKAENRNLELAGISRTLKGLAKDLAIPVMVLSQLSREVTKRSGFRPTLADLRDSGAIESDADLVVFVHREHAFNPTAPSGEAMAIVAKARHGATGDVPLLWVGETTTFRPASHTPTSGFATAEEDPF